LPIDQATDGGGAFLTRQASTADIGRLGLAGAGLIGLHLLLSRLSPEFAYDRLELINRPIWTLVGLGVGTGALYLLIVRQLRGVSLSGVLLVWVVVVGIAVRLMMFSTNPMLEDDHYRYLWDGAVTANGFNPYVYIPDDLLREAEDFEEQASPIGRLALGSLPVIERVNHGHLRTIYPPVAQGAFALAYWIRPWSLLSWRTVLLLFDVAALVLLVVLLRTLGLPSLWLTIYWWNPLLVKEIYNSGHMDVVVLPFLLAALLLAINKRHIWAVVFLALAVGVKVWAIVLLPLLLRPLVTDPKRLLLASGLFGLLVLLMFLPIYLSGLNETSGFIAYGKHWEMNDALFMLFLWGAQLVSPGHAHLVARGVVAIVLGIWVLWVVRKEARGPADLCNRFLFIIAALFLLSPTQFPWYYVWLIPFLAIRPYPSLLLLTVLLPLYYSRFYFDAKNVVDVFDYGIVWLEYVPVWGLLIWEWLVRRKNRSEAGA